MDGISVIIPVYNRERLLGEAIQSVLDQNYDGPIEIIVSDDGSTDRSREVAASFGAPVRVVTRPSNAATRGASAARNRGLAALTQPYTAFLDSDDFYLPEHLNRMAGVLEQRPDIGFVFSRMLKMQESDGNRLFAPWTRRLVTANDIRNPLVSRPFLVHTNILLFRSPVFNDVGGFNESYSNGEDGDLWLRVSEKYKAAFADHYGAVYRMAHGVGQLTDPENRSRIDACASEIYSDALKRYRMLGLTNRYHLFRVRLTLALLGYRRKGKVAALANMARVFCLHPFFALECLSCAGAASRRNATRSMWYVANDIRPLMRLIERQRGGSW